MSTHSIITFETGFISRRNQPFENFITLLSIYQSSFHYIILLNHILGLTQFSIRNSKHIYNKKNMKFNARNSHRGCPAPSRTASNQFHLWTPYVPCCFVRSLAHSSVGEERRTMAHPSVPSSVNGPEMTRTRSEVRIWSGSSLELRSLLPPRHAIMLKCTSSQRCYPWSYLYQILRRCLVRSITVKSMSCSNYCLIMTSARKR